MQQTPITNADVLEAAATKLLNAYVDIRTQATSDKNAMLYANTALNGGTAPWHVASVGKAFEITRRDFVRLAQAQSAEMLQNETTSFVQKLEGNRYDFDANAYLHQIAENRGISLAKGAIIVPSGHLGIAA